MNGRSAWLTNISWLLADRGLKLVAGFAISAWLARALGAELYGVYSLAQAVVVMLTPIVTLGLAAVTVKELIPNIHHVNERVSEILGSTFLMQLVGSLVAILVISIAAYMLRGSQPILAWALVLLSPCLLFRSVDTVRYYFEAKVQSRYVVWVENAAFLVILPIKLGCLFYAASIYVFLALISLELLLVAAGLAWTVRSKSMSINDWRIQPTVMLRLWRQSWPLIFSSLAIVLYMRIDQAMLAWLTTMSEVGVYSVAVKLSETFFIVPTAIVATVFPSLIAQAKWSEQYNKSIQYLLTVLVVTSGSLILCFTVAAPLIIKSVFGPEYEAAVLIFQCHLFSLLAVSFNILSGRWLLQSGWPKLALARNVLGLLLNIAFNGYLIPIYGALGAAVATLLATFFSAYLFDACSSKTRVMFIMKTRALLLLDAGGAWHWLRNHRE